MAAPAKKIKKEDEKLDDQDLDLEEEEEEEEEETPKKKPAAKKEEDTPAWAKTIIKLLTPEEAPPAAKVIPAPKPPAPKEKEVEEDHEKNQDQDPPAPQRTFLSWFW